MANICDNKFYFSCDKNFEYWQDKIENYFRENFDCPDEEFLVWGNVTGNEVSDSDGGCIEGTFESRWIFPMEMMEYLFPDNFKNEDGIYFRCLSEEYGNGYVAMNIYKDNYWKDSQYFDIV